MGIKKEKKEGHAWKNTSGAVWFVSIPNTEAALNAAKPQENRGEAQEETKARQSRMGFRSYKQKIQRNDGNPTIPLKAASLWQENPVTGKP